MYMYYQDTLASILSLVSSVVDFANDLKLPIRMYVHVFSASPVLVEHHGNDELSTIEEDQENMSGEQNSPECDQQLSAEVR